MTRSRCGVAESQGPVLISVVDGREGRVVVSMWPAEHPDLRIWAGLTEEKCRALALILLDEGEKAGRYVAGE